MPAIRARDWTKKSLVQLAPAPAQDLQTLAVGACLNIDAADLCWQVFTPGAPPRKVGQDKFHPHCRFKPESLTADQVAARLAEWNKLKFDWATELVDFRQIRVFRTEAGYLWCSQRMEHYPTPYLLARLKETALRLGVIPKNYTL